MTDSQLIREIKEGNVELYSELMSRYQRKILAFVYHMLKSSNMEARLRKISVLRHSTRRSAVYTLSVRWMLHSPPGCIPSLEIRY